MSSTYAWIITTDHLDLGPECDATGITGPSDASDAMLAELLAGQGERFQMWDDDQILYYEGRAVFAPGTEYSEEGRVGPLVDFGAPDSGCVRITWPKHPELTCEW